VSACRRNVGQDRAPQADELLIHRVWDVNTLERLEASVSCLADSTRGPELLQQSRRPDIPRPATP
jgi:hypothetical protein